MPLRQPRCARPISLPNKADGAADGQRNPEVDQHTDRQALGRVCASVPSLALAWYCMGDEKYESKILTFGVPGIL